MSGRLFEALLRAARVRRAEWENVTKDATREGQQLFVVPALLDAPRSDAAFGTCHYRRSKVSRICRSGDSSVEPALPPFPSSDLYNANNPASITSTIDKTLGYGQFPLQTLAVLGVWELVGCTISVLFCILTHMRLLYSS